MKAGSFLKGDGVGGGEGGGVELIRGYGGGGSSLRAKLIMVFSTHKR